MVLLVVPAAAVPRAPYQVSLMIKIENQNGKQTMQSRSTHHSAKSSSSIQRQRIHSSSRMENQNDSEELDSGVVSSSSVSPSWSSSGNNNYNNIDDKEESSGSRRSSNEKSASRLKKRRKEKKKKSSSDLKRKRDHTDAGLDLDKQQQRKKKKKRKKQTMVYRLQQQQQEDDDDDDDESSFHLGEENNYESTACKKHFEEKENQVHVNIQHLLCSPATAGARAQRRVSKNSKHDDSASFTTIPLNQNSIHRKNQAKKEAMQIVEEDDDEAMNLSDENVVMNGEREDEEKDDAEKNDLEQSKSSIKALQVQPSQKREQRQEQSSTYTATANTNDNDMEEMQRIQAQRFEREKRRVLASLPKQVKDEFKEMGFVKWEGKSQCVLILGPYDVCPGEVRELWMKMYKEVSAVHQQCNFL